MRSLLQLALPVVIASSATSAWAAYPDCPSAGPAALEAWKNEAAASVKAGNSAGDAIKACFPTTIPKCLQRLAADNDDPPSADYDSLYSSDQKRLPKVFKGPGNGADEFQIPPNIEDIIKGTAQAPGGTGEQVDYKKWKVAKYKSRSTGGFDLGDVGPTSPSTESLMLIFVPGDSFTPKLDYDRWINIGLPSDQGADRFKPEPQRKLPRWSDYSNPDAVLPQTLTMLTMQKPSATAPAKILFQNFNRQGSTPSYKGSPSNPSGCTSCHANGMRAISPLGYFAPGVTPPTLNDGNKWMNPNGQNGSTVPQLPPTTQAVVSDMNNIMSSYGKVDWGTSTDPDGKKRTFYDPYNHGVGLGSMTPAKPRDDAFMNGCMNLQTELTYTSIRGIETKITRGGIPPNLARVKAAMNCAMCHGGSRAPVNKVFDRNEVEFKILVDRSMPMVGGQSLTDSDRLALVNCLYAELPDNDEAWMKAVSCTASSSQLVGPTGDVCSVPDSSLPAGTGSAVSGIIHDVNQVVGGANRAPGSSNHTPRAPAHH